MIYFPALPLLATNPGDATEKVLDEMRNSGDETKLLLHHSTSLAQTVITCIQEVTF